MSSFTWVPYGEDISLEDNWSFLAIALSGQGDRIAISDSIDTGVVRVFDYSNSTSSSWTQVGNDLVGQGEYYGGPWTSLSSNGEFLAIGENSNLNGPEAGNVRVFQISPNTNLWVQMGVDILGESKYDRSGRSVSLSDDGKTLAIGSPGNDGVSGLGDTGQAKMYKFKNGAWSQTGPSIYGEAGGDQDGASVYLAGDGKTVAIGSEYDGSNQVRIFRQWANSKWKQIGKPIQGEDLICAPLCIQTWNGYSISLSQDGDTIAVGTPMEVGYVRVFRFVKGNWKQLGKTFRSQDENTAPIPYEGFGWDVEVSDYGNVLAIG